MTQTPALPDTRPSFFTALDQIDALIRTVSLADLDLPTPCDGWTVRELLGHLVAVSVRVPHVAAGGHPFEVPSQVTGIADDGWLAAWGERQDALRAAAADDNDRSRIVHHPAGEMPWAIALGTYASELATHGWDLASALGRADELDQDLATAVLPPMLRGLPAEPRGAEVGVPFGPVIEVPDDAAPYAKLVGWLGRDPYWVRSV